MCCGGERVNAKKVPIVFCQWECIVIKIAISVS